MDPVSLTAFEDEMSKIAGLRDLWRKLTDVFRPHHERVQLKVDYFFSPKAGTDRWGKLTNQVRDQKFVDAIVRHPLADEALKMHVQSMHDLSHGQPVGKINSSDMSGKTYEVRKLPDGTYGCQCGDWRYRGSVIPGYECKHVQAFRAGKRRAD